MQGLGQGGWHVARDVCLVFRRFVVVGAVSWWCVFLRVVVDALVDHQGDDAHLGSAAVVQLNTTLADLLLLRKRIPAEINVSITEVTHKLSLTCVYLFVCG